MFWWIAKHFWTLYSPDLDDMERELLADFSMGSENVHGLHEQLWAMREELVN